MLPLSNRHACADEVAVGGQASVCVCVCVFDCCWWKKNVRNTWRAVVVELVAGRAEAGEDVVVRVYQQVGRNWNERMWRS